MTAEPDDRGAIRAVLDRFALGWRQADAAILKSTWDRDYAGLYIASEKPAPLHGYSEIGQGVWACIQYHESIKYEVPEG